MFLSPPMTSGHGRAKLQAQCKNGLLTRITPKIFVRTQDWDQLQPSEKLKTTAIAVSQYHNGAVVTGRAAATLLELPITSYANHVHLLRARSNTSSLKNVTISAAPQAVLARSELVEVEDSSGQVISIKVTCPSDTIAYIAKTDGYHEAVVTADHCLSTGIVDRPDLEQILSEYKKSRRFNQVLATLQFMSASAESARETQLRLAMIDAGFRGFSAQPTIRLTHSGNRFRPDFVFFAEMVIVEYDGADKYESASIDYLRKEIDRHHELSNAGFTFVRIRNEHFKDDSWIDLLRQALARGPQSPRLEFEIHDEGEFF